MANKKKAAPKKAVKKAAKKPAPETAPRVSPRFRRASAEVEKVMAAHGFGRFVIAAIYDCEGGTKQDVTAIKIDPRNAFRLARSLAASALETLNGRL